MKIFALSSLLLAFATLGGGALYADSKPKLTLGMAVYPPYTFVNYNGQPTGIDVDITTEILKRMGYEPVVTHGPWKRMQNEGAKGRLSIAFTMTVSKWRSKHFYISDPVSEYQEAFYKRKSDNISWEKMSDLKKYAVGVSGGYNYPEELKKAIDQKLFKVDLVHSDDPELMNLRKLAAGRIDLAVCGVRICSFIMKKFPKLAKIIDVVKKPIGEPRGFSVGFSKKWPGSKKLMEQFNKELKKYISEGSQQKVFDDYK